jgi:hypothetical protein
MEPEPEPEPEPGLQQQQQQQQPPPEGVPPDSAAGARRRRAPLQHRLRARRRQTIVETVERTREWLQELEQRAVEQRELSELQGQHAAWARIWALDRHPPILEHLEATVAFDGSSHVCLVGFAQGDVLAVTAKLRPHWWEGYNETERARAPDTLPQVGFFPACPGVRIASKPPSSEAGAAAGAVDPRQARRSSVPAALALHAAAATATAGRVLLGTGSGAPHTPANVQTGLDFIDGRLRKTEHALQAANRKLSAAEGEAAGVAASIAAVSSVYGTGAGAQLQAEMVRLEARRRHVEQEFVKAEELQRNLVKSVQVYEAEAAQARSLLRQLQDAEEQAARAKIKARGGRKTRRFSLN